MVNWITATCCHYTIGQYVAGKDKHDSAGCKAGSKYVHLGCCVLIICAVDYVQERKNIHKRDSTRDRGTIR